MFNHLGNAYILNSIEAVYAYYKENNLLLQIPFYYFFKHIREQVGDEKIGEYAKQINEYLKKCYAPDAGSSDAE